MTTSDETPAPGPTDLPEARLVRIEARLASSEAESIELRGAVQELTSALTVLNEVRRKQQDTAERVDEAAELAVAAKAESISRTSRLWRAVIGVAVGAALLMLVINVLMFAGLTNYIVDLLNQQRVDRLASCEKRNEATLSNIRREEALAAADPVAAVEKIHLDSARELRKGIVDCEKVTRVAR